MYCARLAKTGVTIEFTDTDDIHVWENSLSGQRFDYKAYKNLEIQLLGAYQRQNAAGVIAVIERLRAKGWTIAHSAITRGLAKTKWAARFEIVNQNPHFIVDGGHNPQCAKALTDNLAVYFSDKKIIFIIGVMADKDYDQMFRQIIPLAKRIFTVTPDSKRALPAEELAEYFAARGIEDAASCDSVESGVQAALHAAQSDDVICAFGSLYMSGVIRGMFGL